MNFPLELPVFQFLSWLVNTAGIGAAIVGLIVAGVVACFGLTLRWIAAAKNLEGESYPYPPQH